LDWGEKKKRLNTEEFKTQLKCSCLLKKSKLSRPEKGGGGGGGGEEHDKVERQKRAFETQRGKKDHFRYIAYDYQVATKSRPRGGTEIRNTPTVWRWGTNHTLKNDGYRRHVVKKIKMRTPGSIITCCEDDGVR